MPMKSLGWVLIRGLIDKVAEVVRFQRLDRNLVGAMRQNLQEWSLSVNKLKFQRYSCLYLMQPSSCLEIEIFLFCIPCPRWGEIKVVKEITTDTNEFHFTTAHQQTHSDLSPLALLFHFLSLWPSLLLLGTM